MSMSVSVSQLLTRRSADPDRYKSILAKVSEDADCRLVGDDGAVFGKPEAVSASDVAAVNKPDLSKGLQHWENIRVRSPVRSRSM